MLHTLLKLINKPLVIFLISILVSSEVFAAKQYSETILGDPNFPVSAQPISATPSVVLMGGGYDVAEAFRWLIKQAGIRPGTGGRFVILRATGTDAYNNYIFSRLGTIDTTTPELFENVGGQDLGLSSVSTIIVPNLTAANDPTLADKVNAANVIWIAGGDQADYVNYWQGTLLAGAIQAAIRKNIPIGGTSAGNAVLGQYAFAALNGTVTSSQALSDPFNKYMTIDPINTQTKKNPATGLNGFVQIDALNNLITDDHFDTRNRMGRLMAFMSRISTYCSGGVVSPPSNAHAIGVDEGTALLIQGNTAQLVSNPAYTGTINSNSVYFLSFNSDNTSCSSGNPLMGDFTIQRITANQSAGLTTGVDGSPTSTASYPKYSYYNFYYFDLDKKWKGSDTYTNHVSVQ